VNKQPEHNGNNERKIRIMKAVIKLTHIKIIRTYLITYHAFQIIKDKDNKKNDALINLIICVFCNDSRSN